MKVTREQAEANRQKVVGAASTLFRKHGFDGIGVADIMKAAGLTHGGFYGQFDSKDDLAAEACSHAVRRSWDVWIKPSSEGGPEAIVRNYLATSHRNDRAQGCLFAALGSEIARQPRAIRHAVTDGFRDTIERLLNLLPGRSATARRKRALPMMCGLVGALILSRAVDDTQLSEEILEAATAAFGHVPDK
jgi:TetR/AcrR family transcriptional regulator, transcriptional repressor for nem operon